MITCCIRLYYKLFVGAPPFQTPMGKVRNLDRRLGQACKMLAEKLDSLRGSSVKTGTMQRRSAWPLRKDDTHESRSVNNLPHADIQGTGPERAKHCFGFLVPCFGFLVSVRQDVGGEADHRQLVAGLGDDDNNSNNTNNSTTTNNNNNNNAKHNNNNNHDTNRY